MRNKSWSKDLYAIIAYVISGALCVVLIFVFWQKNESSLVFGEVLKTHAIIFIGLSGILSAILMVFLANSALSLNVIKAKIISRTSKITQQMHHIRNIAEILFNSNIWQPGLREFMEKDYADLTYFEVKEFYKGNCKMAIEFLQETHPFGETENLYLEMKSLLMTQPKEKHLPETITYPESYDNKIIEKWVEHKSGSGLWYVFGYKYGNYKDSLNLDAVFERHQEKILTLANTIDHNVFESSSFNDVFLAKLWEYMTKEIIPKLNQFNGQMKRITPRLVRYLYFVFLVLVIFGVLLPILYLMIDFSNLAIIAGYSIVISTIFHVAITFHTFLTKEANN